MSYGPRQNSKPVRRKMLKLASAVNLDVQVAEKFAELASCNYSQALRTKFVLPMAAFVKNVGYKEKERNSR